MKKIRSLLSPVLAIALLWLSPPLTGQVPPPSAFGEVIEVRVVNLEVVVEDRKGQRVTGIPREDFRLRVDGQETPIQFFTEVVEGRAAGSGSAVGGMASGDPVGTSYLVFIDEYFGIRQDRDRVLEGIAEEISRLGPADRMAVVAFDGKRLDLISNWSQSPADLQEALRAAMKRPSRGLLTRTFLRTDAPNRPYASTRNLIDELEVRLENVALAVTATLRSFANPPGRKVMLLMSGGWPHSPERWAANSEFIFDYRHGDRILAPIYETANLLGYTLYPIDGPGIVHGGPDASQAGPPGPVSYVREDEVHQTLRILAQATGGRAILDSARLTSLDRVIEDTRTYYWLGFSPQWRGDNRNHKVELEVLRPGLRVRHRGGFEDMSRQKEVDFIVEGAMLFGELPGSQPLRVEMGKPRRDGRRFLLPLKLFIPLDAVTVLVHRGRYVTRLELRLAAIDKNGHRSELDRIPITLSGSRPPVPGQTGEQEVAARVRRQKHDLVVSLHDPLNGTILASVLHFDPKR